MNDTATNDPDLDYDEGWYPEEPGQVRYGFCDDLQLHGPHVYTALNGWTLECRGWDEADRADLIELMNQPPCEHGLSQHLCAGPGHYPMDEERF